MWAEGRQALRNVLLLLVFTSARPTGWLPEEVPGSQGTCSEAEEREKRRSAGGGVLDYGSA